MDRRSFLQTALSAGALPAAARAWPPAAGTPRQVVVIVGESVRADMLRCYRETGLRTPNLDRLAGSGMRFTHAYNCQPVCSPARSALWTGLYPHSNGVWGNSMPLGDTVHTLGQFLHDKEVHAALIGKWHVDGTDYFGAGRSPGGWDPAAWYDMRNYLEELSPADRVRSRKSSTALTGNWPAELCFAHRCTDRAVGFLENHRGQDFLLAVCYDEPHDPSLCPKPYIDEYAGYTFPRSPNVDDPLTEKPDEQRLWAGPRLHTTQPPVRDAQFFGCHSFVDAEIGRLMEEIDRSAPGALVIFTSDHGVFLESHRLTDKGPAMYDEITRIPSLVRWPGHTPAGSVNANLFSHIDLVPTVIDFFGLSVPPTLEGRSMLQAFCDPAAPTRETVFVEWGRYEIDHDGFGGYQPIRCACDERFKLSVNLNSTDELYDLEADPGELTNLIRSPAHAAERNRLHDRLLAWMNETRDPFRGYYWGHRPWRPEFAETWQFFGMTRQRASDGYLPPELDYDTGLPANPLTRPKPGPA